MTGRSVRFVTISVGFVLLATGAAAQSDAPRTSWGQPDLRGVWDFRTITPMQRPESLADNEFLTGAEATSLDQAAVDRNNRANEPSVVRTEPLPAGGNVGSYNSFWMDSGTRTVETKRTSLIVDPPNGRMPSLTADREQRAEARQKRRRESVADSWLDFNPYDRCILGFNAGPPMTPSAYNNNMQLFQTADHVVLVTEMVHTVRIVPLDGRVGLTLDVRQWSGDSRGYWDGETLVIETQNFAEKRRWRGTTESMHLVERLTRVDADTLLYEFTVTDPEIWTSSWTVEVPMRLNSQPMYEYACHEGHYSMALMLAGRRSEEKAAAERP